VLGLWAARADAPALQAAVIAAGTLAMGLLLARRSAYHRWAYLGATGVLAVSALMSPLVVSPERWRESFTPMLWMHTWWPMVMAWVPPGSRRTWCSPDAPASGWMLIGAALLFALLTYASVWI
jgi:hypothetical protein